MFGFIWDRINQELEAMELKPGYFNLDRHAKAPLPPGSGDPPTPIAVVDALLEKMDEEDGEKFEPRRTLH